MDILEEDSLAFLSALYKRKVEFIIVGGAAVNYYGYSRATGDLDIWLKDNLQNRQNLVSALNDYGIKGSEFFLKHPLIVGFAEVMMDNGVYVDLMAELTKFGKGDFETCYNMSEDWQPIEGFHVKILHLNQLIEEKEKNARPKDLEDALQLKQIREKLP
jgi:predicted nucleotidyltransferase